MQRSTDAGALPVFDCPVIGQAIDTLDQLSQIAGQLPQTPETQEIVSAVNGLRDVQS